MRDTIDRSTFHSVDCLTKYKRFSRASRKLSAYPPRTGFECVQNPSDHIGLMRPGLFQSHASSSRFITISASIALQQYRCQKYFCFMSRLCSGISIQSSIHSDNVYLFHLLGIACLHSIILPSSNKKARLTGRLHRVRKPSTRGTGLVSWCNS